MPEAFDKQGNPIVCYYAENILNSPRKIDELIELGSSIKATTDITIHTAKEQQTAFKLLIQQVVESHDNSPL